MVKGYPTAKEVWERIPRPSLTPKTLLQSRTKHYVIRITEGKSIYKEEPLYIVEVRNVFGMIDKFCDLFTEQFNDKKAAISYYNTVKREAIKEYKRLKEKQERRIQEWHDANNAEKS